MDRLVCTKLDLLVEVRENPCEMVGSQGHGVQIDLGVGDTINCLGMVAPKFIVHQYFGENRLLSDATLSTIYLTLDIHPVPFI